ncbi:hypothetical protein ACFRSX_35330 [Streptomyces goshikiensis]
MGSCSARSGDSAAALLRGERGLDVLVRDRKVPLALEELQDGCEVGGL